MTSKWHKKTIDCDFEPTTLYQASAFECPGHQVGQLVLDGAVFRPNLIRAVVNKVTEGRGSRSYGEHTHDVYHLVIPRSNVATLRHNGAVVIVNPGELHVISPGEPHQFMIEVEACCYTALTFEFIDVQGERPFALPFADLLSHISGEPVIGMNGTLMLPEYAETVVHRHASDMARAAEDSPAQCAMQLVQLLLDVASWHNDMTTAPPPDTQLEQVYDTIRKRFREPLPVDELALLASMSRRTLTRRFKKRFGTAMKALQIQLRMDTAKSMLRTTNMQVQEVAEEIGYGDLYQFTTAFTHHVGSAPSSYRRSVK